MQCGGRRGMMRVLPATLLHFTCCDHTLPVLSPQTHLQLN